ncbi:Cof-type HAD-IIB family hydrolase, partial [Treponema pedis]
MKYKVLVIDLDDTLLRDDLTISEITKKALLSAQERGVIVVITTGRPLYACMHIAKEICLDKYKGYILAFNGAKIYSITNNKVLQAITIPKEIIHELYKLSKKYGVYIHTYLDNKIITAENNKYTEIERNLTGMNVVEVNDFIKYVDRDVIKAILLQEPKYLQSVAGEIKKEISQNVNITFSKPFFLECMNSIVDKAFGLTELLKILHYSSNEVVAVGDSHNDISMIKIAGLGVAMGNS